MNRTKARIADIDKKIGTQAADEERRTHVRSVMNRLAELSTHLQSQLNNADWATKREIVRALVQRIEIGPTTVAVVPSTDGNERPSYGADYGDIVPGVKPKSTFCRRLWPWASGGAARFRQLSPPTAFILAKGVGHQGAETSKVP